MRLQNAEMCGSKPRSPSCFFCSYVFRGFFQLIIDCSVLKRDTGRARVHIYIYMHTRTHTYADETFIKERSVFCNPTTGNRM